MLLNCRKICTRQLEAKLLICSGVVLVYSDVLCWTGAGEAVVMFGFIKGSRPQYKFKVMISFSFTH